MGSQSSSLMDESVKIFVDDTIGKNKVVVFSKSYCPYCKRAKDIINGYKISPDLLEIIELEQRPDCSQIQAYLKTLTGASSVPRIFVAGNSVGGCDDLTKIHSSGQFQKMLEEAKIL